MPRARFVALLRAATLWLCGAGALAMQVAQAQPSAADVERALALARQGAQALAPPGARIVAQAGNLDARMRLAPCQRAEPYLAAGANPWGQTRVGLRCTAGAVAWSIFLPVQVQVLAPALVSRQALPAGALVASDQWQLAEIDWAADAAPPLADASAVDGRALARPMAAGQALRSTDLRPRRWFASGQTVRVVAAGAGFAISTEGQAMSHGVEGQPVRVRTESGRILVGLPTAEGRVEVPL